MSHRERTERLRDALERLDRRPRPTQDCPPGEVLLAAVRAELDPERMRAVGAHAVECDPCGEGWRMARGIASGRIPQPEAAAPPAPERGFAPPIVPSPSFGRWGVGVSAAALAAVASLLLVGPPAGEAPGSDAPAVEEPIVSRLDAARPLPRQRFVLRWSGPEEARYRIRVATQDMRPLVTSLEIRTREYRINPQVLEGVAPGAVIVWQVTALMPDGREVLSPHFTVPVE